jgi:hypothetical protein
MELHDIVNYCGLFGSLIFLAARFNSRDFIDYLYGLSFMFFFLLKLRPITGVFYDTASISIAICILLVTCLKLRNKYRRKP